MTVNSPSATDTTSGQRLCPNCGVTLGQADGECPACGQALCPRCQAAIAEDADKCPACGMQIELACPDCGSILKPSDTRCLRCGTTFQSAASQSVAVASASSPDLPVQIQQAHAYAVSQLKAKVDPAQVEEQLMAGGLSRSAAHAMISTLLVTRRQAERAQGRRTMLLGVLWAVGGLVITLAGQALARERGGSYYILWGAVIIGTLQILVGLRLFLRNDPIHLKEDTQLQAHPTLVANNCVWPMPTQNKAGWIGMLVFLGFMAVLSFSNLGSPLISQPAAQLNLTSADLGVGFKMTKELGPNAETIQEGGDTSQRTFWNGNNQVASSVIVGKERWIDDPGDLLRLSEKGTGESDDVVWGRITPITMGERAAMRSFTATKSLEQRTGFMMTFIKNNVIVVLTESNPNHLAKPDRLLTLARIIEGRMK